MAGLALSPDGRRLLVDQFPERLRQPDQSCHGQDNRTGSSARGHRSGEIRRSGRDVSACGCLDIGHDGLCGQSARPGDDCADHRPRYVMTVTHRIATIGQPVALLATPRGRLFVALDNTDSVAVIDAASRRTLETIPTAGPGLLSRPRRLAAPGRMPSACRRMDARCWSATVARTPWRWSGWTERPRALAGPESLTPTAMAMAMGTTTIRPPPIDPRRSG